jgi:hypothetical protein
VGCGWVESGRRREERGRRARRGRETRRREAAMAWGGKLVIW